MLSRILGALALMLAAGCTGSTPSPSTPALAVTRAAPRADNGPQMAALGQRLFFERRLSADGKVACASCHDPARAFTDGRVSSIGVGGREGQRNAPTVLNARYQKTLFWDGRVTTLEDQAALPILNPSEMGQPSLEAAVAAIARDRAYRDGFRAVFGSLPNGPDLVRALAAYERTQTAFAAPFDAWIAGNPTAISPAAQRGWTLFLGKARCTGCHAVASGRPDTTFFLDHRFHNIGVGIERHNVVALACRARMRLDSGDVLAVDQAAIQSELSALGSFLVTKQSADIAAFRTPGLRNVAVTAPYFHDGSARTLWDVVNHYNKGGMSNPWLDDDIRPLALSDREVDDVVAFLASLTSAPYAGLGERELARQREIAGRARPERDVAAAFARRPVRPDPALACAARRAAVASSLP